MIYNTLIIIISRILREHKTNIDSLAKELKDKKQNLEIAAAEKSVKWKPEFIEEWKKENDPSPQIAVTFAELRKKTVDQLMPFLELLEKNIVHFFNAPISEDFANKVMLTKLTDIQLSDREFGLLSDTVSSYMEYRLLNEIAKTRTKKQYEIKVGKDSIPEKTIKDISDPYYLKNISPDVVISAFERWKSSALRLANTYSGKDGSLGNMLPKPIPLPLVITADSYIRNREDEKLAAKLDETISIIPTKSKKYLPLSPIEKETIDVLLAPYYKTAETIRWAAGIHEETKNLLERDSRYSHLL